MFSASALLLIFPAALAVAAVSDLLTMTIPNRISLALVAAFAVVAPVAGLGWSQIGLHVATGFAVLVLGFALFALNVFGGGDAKLLAAVSLWLGPEALFAFTAIAAVLGGLLAILLLAFRAIPMPPALYKHEWIARLHHHKTGIPYGIALAAAGLWVYPKTQIFLSFAA